jgi:hypothetical protein
MNDDAQHARWLATATYRSNLGPTEVDYQFEELSELQSLIERGPHWDALERIEIILNPHRVAHPGLTVEAAEDL